MSKDKLAQVFHFDLYGKREDKYEFLNRNDITSISFNEINLNSPNFSFSITDSIVESEYNKGFSVNELFPLNGTGIVSKRDAIAFKDSKEEIVTIIKDIQELSCEEIKKKFDFVSWESRDGKVEFVKNNVLEYGIKEKYFIQCDYRPFDKKWTYYNGKSKGFIGWPVFQVMKHFLNNENFGLVVGRQSTDNNWCNVQVSKNMIDNRYHFSYKGTASQFPLYLYPETNSQLSIGESQNRVPNLNMAIVNQIAERAGLYFQPEKTSPTPPKEGLSQAGYIKEMRDGLKDNPTEAEKVIWEFLRNKKTGYKIRRQHIIDNFITDFVCLSNKLVIEIDGKIHLQQKEYDELRTARLHELGYEVIRFTNEEVFANPQKVADKIKEKLDSYAINPPPLEGLGEVFYPIDLLDYIYAVLHSPAYREKYKEFLKIDFPRVPYPTNLMIW